MPRLVTFADLHSQNHSLGLYCAGCNRWREAELESLIAAGQGERLLTETRFSCRDCGCIAEMQLRPPVPRLGGAGAYI